MEFARYAKLYVAASEIGSHRCGMIPLLSPYLCHRAYARLVAGHWAVKQCDPERKTTDGRELLRCTFDLSGFFNWLMT